MAKIFYVVAFLAVCQYAAAAATNGVEDNSQAAVNEKAVALIREYTPTVVANTLDAIQIAVSKLPNPEEIDALLNAGGVSINIILSQIDEAQKLASYIGDNLPKIIASLTDALKLAAIQYIQSLADSQFGQTVAEKAAAITSGISQGVEKANGVVRSVRSFM